MWCLPPGAGVRDTSGCGRRRTYALGGAVFNAVNLALGGDYAGFAGQAHFGWVTSASRAVLAPNQLLFSGLLVAFEAPVGVLILSGGRRTQPGLVGVIGFSAPGSEKRRTGRGVDRAADQFGVHAYNIAPKGVSGIQPVVWDKSRRKWGRRYGRGQALQPGRDMTTSKMLRELVRRGSGSWSRSRISLGPMQHRTPP